MSRPLAPFLDIEELLGQKKWKNSKFTTEDIRSIQDTISFLRLVLIGQELANRTAKDRVLTANSSAINAFNIANRGYQYLGVKHQISLDAITERTIAILMNLLSHDISKEELSFTLDELDLAHQFLRNIANVVLPRTYIP